LGAERLRGLVHGRSIALLAVAVAGCPHGQGGDDGGEDTVVIAQAVTCDPAIERYPIAAPHNGGYDRAWNNFTCAPHPGGSPDNSDYGGDHHGNNLFAPRGSPIVAVRAGRVTRAGDVSPTSGLRVTIEDACGWSYYAGHLDSIAPGIAVGVRVTAGQVIGTLGDTGTRGTAPLNEPRAVSSARKRPSRTLRTHRSPTRTSMGSPCQALPPTVILPVTVARSAGKARPSGTSAAQPTDDHQRVALAAEPRVAGLSEAQRPARGAGAAVHGAQRVADGGGEHRVSHRDHGARGREPALGLPNPRARRHVDRAQPRAVRRDRLDHVDRRPHELDRPLAPRRRERQPSLLAPRRGVEDPQALAGDAQYEAPLRERRTRRRDLPLPAGCPSARSIAATSSPEITTAVDASVMISTIGDPAATGRVQRTSPAPRPTRKRTGWGAAPRAPVARIRSSPSATAASCSPRGRARAAIGGRDGGPPPRR
jgi:hypothetical protein